MPLRYEIRSKCCCATPSVSKMLSTSFLDNTHVSRLNTDKRRNLSVDLNCIHSNTLLSSTYFILVYLFIGGWWRVSYLVASSLVASLPGGEVTGCPRTRRDLCFERPPTLAQTEFNQSLTRALSIQLFSWHLTSTLSGNLTFFGRVFLLKTNKGGV